MVCGGFGLRFFYVQKIPYLNCNKFRKIRSFRFYSPMVRRILQSFLLAFQNIRSNLFHTFLSVLGIVIGVGALVSILSLIDGMEEYARAQITQTSSLNAIIIQTKVHRNVNGISLRKDTFSLIDYEHLKELQKSLTKPIASKIVSSVIPIKANNAACLRAIAASYVLRFVVVKPMS